MKLSRERYYGGEYFAETRHFYEEVFEDNSDDGKGRLGECLIYEVLREMTGARRFLFGPTIKIGNSEAEGDVLVLHETGIYVFESKNFSGRVSGSEGKKKWVQFLNGWKHFPENPVRQNERLIQNIFAFLGPEFCKVPYFSFVVLGAACTPGNICVETSEHAVVTPEYLKRGFPAWAERNCAVLDGAAIGELFRCSIQPRKNPRANGKACKTGSHGKTACAAREKGRQPAR